MTSITDGAIYLQVAKKSVGGYENPSVPPAKELNYDEEQDMPQRKGELTEDELLIMEEYAKWLPQGKRQLKLNVPQLRNTLLATDLIAAPLTKESGKNRGGMISLKPDEIVPLTQGEHISLLNQNRNAGNPNYTGFRNDFMI